MKTYSKYLLSLIMSLSLCSAFAQELPKVIPPSPTVANLMQFEEVPVSYYTGQPNISIPFYSKAINGDLAINIGLSYNTQGVKINNRSGWTGTGWSLSAGGVISRTVRGLPDEMERNSGLIVGEGVLHNDDYWNYETLTDSLKQKFLWRSGGTTQDVYDHQSDLFQFNVLGMSGRFILVKENNTIVPKLLSKNQTLQIDIDYNTTTYELNAFTITDTNGYIYTFDQKEQVTSQPFLAIELFDNSTSVSGSGQDYISTNAWHLSKIELPNLEGQLGEELVTFTYQTSQETYTASVTRTESRPINPPIPQWNDYMAIPYNASVTQAKASHSYLTTGTSTQKLDRITFKDGTFIEFNLSSHGSHPETGGSSLDYIRIKDAALNENKHFKFHYENNTSNNRLWLTSIDEVAGTTTNTYTLEYNDRSNLPAFDTVNATDDWGYNKSTTSGTCGLVIPDNTAIQKGLLERIIYPTGGSKEFEFERHTITYQGNTQLTDDEYRDKNPDNWIPQQVPLSYNSSTDNSAQGSTTYDSFTISQRQTVVYKKDSTTATASEQFNAYIEVTGPNSYKEVFRLSDDEVQFTIDAGAYEVRFYTLDTGTNYTFNGCIGYKNFETNIKRYIYGGGVRIKRILFKDDPSDTDNQRQFIFNYDEFDSQNTSTGSVDGLLTGITKTYERTLTRFFLPETCAINANAIPVSFDFEISTRGLNAELTQGQYVGYKKVKVNERYNGYTFYNYTSAQDHYSPASTFTYPYTPAEDLDYKRGLLLSQEVYDDNDVKLKETINTYSFVEDNISKMYLHYDENCQWKQFYNLYNTYKEASLNNGGPDNYFQQCSGVDPLNKEVITDIHFVYIGVLNLQYRLVESYIVEIGGNSPCNIDCFAGSYDTCDQGATSVPFFFKSADIKSTWARLDTTTNKEYFYDGATTMTKEWDKVFTYNTSNYQVADEVTTYKEKGVNEQYETEYYYSVDASVTSTPSTIKTKMVNLNKINDVLETITYKNGTQISQTNTIYDEFATDQVLPHKVQTQKGTGLTEDRIEFKRYDAYNNPIEVKKTNGIDISYVWGFDNTVPVAKVVNAEYSDIEALSGFGSGFSLSGNLSAAQDDALRTLSTSTNCVMVDTYTYDPLIGVLSAKDARDYETTYVYDDLNRLQSVKDQDGYLLNKNEYVYGPQSYVKTIAYQVETTDGTTHAITGASLQDDDKIESIAYVDGLGRALQSITKQGGGNYQDIIVPVEYDDYGRQAIEYLPYADVNQAVNSANLNFRTVSTLMTDLEAYYVGKYSEDQISASSINAYANKSFEASPLSRVLEQGAPGKDWLLNTSSDSDHTIKFEYLSNTFDDADPTNANNDNIVRYKVTFNGGNTADPVLVYDNHYKQGELYKTVTKDENWQPGHGKDHTVEEYKDAQGRVLVKRTFNTEDPHDTYYVYDDFGNLTYVLPPKSEPSDTTIPTATELDQLCYQYRYDHRNRLIEKKIPGKGWEYIVYNLLDQPILTQDPNLKKNNQWLFTKYDPFGRIAYTGFINSGSTRSALQTAADGTVNTAVLRVSSSITLAGTPLYYNNGGYPTTNITEILTINYYDDYNWDTLKGFEASYVIDDPNNLSQLGNSISKNAGGTAWNAGFETNGIIQDDGYIQWTMAQNHKRIMVGLSRTNSAPDDSYTTIDYALYTTDLGTIGIYEEGATRAIPNTYYQPGDVFKVERIGDQIVYKKNEVIFYSSSTPSTGVLLGDSSFYQEGGAIEDVHIGYSGLGQAFTQNAKGLATGSKIRTLGQSSWTHNETRYDIKARPIRVDSKNGYLQTTDALTSQLDFNGKVIETHSSKLHEGEDKPTPVVTVDKFAYDHTGRLLRQTQIVNDQKEELIFKNSYDEVGQLYKKEVGGTLNNSSSFVNVSTELTVSSTNVTKTTGTDGWNAGLSTLQSIAGDGYIKFTTEDTNKSYMAGLNYTDNSVGVGDLDYAIYVVYNGVIRVYENGINKGDKATHAPGDTFAVERRGKVVYYLKNGVPFYRSTILSTGAPMIGDTSVYHVGVSINDLVLVDLDKGLQSVDYDYNIRGWLRHINDVDALGNDLFGFEIGYNNPEANISGLQLPQYNGNISETQWKTASLDHNNNPSEKHTYAYNYDDLNRIKVANFGFGDTFTYTAAYKLNITQYDKNGNIVTLYRNGKNSTPGNNAYAPYDHLSYTYTGNQLTEVNDLYNVAEGYDEGSNSGAGTDYTYDDNGNMVADDSKDITAIDYNHLNLPTHVRINGQERGDIYYVYDATGVKLSKHVADTNQGTDLITEYCGNFIYEKTSPTGYSTLKFFSQPEGYVEKTNKGEFNYVYQYKDHLGNVRLTYFNPNDDFNTILDSDLTTTIDGWQYVGASALQLDNGRLKVDVEAGYQGTRHDLSNMTVAPGDDINIKLTFDKGDTQSNVRLLIKEFDTNMTLLATYTLNGNLQTGSYDYNHTVNTGVRLQLVINKDGTNTSSLTSFYIDHASVTSGALEIIEEHNYYPFGLKHKGYNDVVSANSNSQATKYKYNGKELSQELGMNLYEYGARFYDPAISLFTSIDPRAETFSFQSTYVYAANNPVYYEEKNGEYPWPPGLRKLIKRSLDYIASKTESKAGKFAVGWVEGGVEMLPDGQSGAEAFIAKVHRRYIGAKQVLNGDLNNGLTNLNAGGRGDRYDIAMQVKKIKEGDMREAGKFTRGAVETVGALVAPVKFGPRMKPRASGLGDLTIAESRSIQGAVDMAGRPIEVVGSAAKGTRRNPGSNLPIGKGDGTKSDIDYVAPPSSIPYFNPKKLPSLDPNTGIIPGKGNQHIGPFIRFEPGGNPFIIKMLDEQ